MSHKKYRTEKNCLNCGAEVPAKFCTECGQENLEVRDNFFHLTGHFIADYLHFDSKFFRSLIPLFTKPGFLTRQYLEGKRTQYIHPLRLFFFVTIIFVLSTSIFYNKFGDEFKSQVVRPDPDFVKMDTVLLNGYPDEMLIFLQIKNDSITVKEAKEQIRIQRRLQKKFHGGFDMVFKNLKYITFFLLPIYALIFKLLYIRHKVYYVDHLVFMMHVQTFVYILFSVTLLLPIIFDVGINIIRHVSLSAIIIYIGISLYRVYHDKWWKLIIKTLAASSWVIFLTIFCMIALSVIL